MRKFIFFSVLSLIISTKCLAGDCVEDSMMSAGCRPTSSTANAIPAQTLAQAQASIAQMERDVQAFEQQNNQQELNLSMQAVTTGISQAKEALARGDITKYRELMTEVKKDMSAATDAMGKLGAGAADPCTEQAEKTASSCNMLEPGMQAMLQGALANAKNTMNQGGGTEKICKAMNMVQTIAQGANFALAMKCEMAIGSCRKICRPMSTQAKNPQYPASVQKRADAALRQCSELEGKVIAAGVVGIQNMLQSAVAGGCQKNTAAIDPNATPPGGLMDCSNPMLQGTPQCVCPNNPADPMCSGNNAGLETGGFSSGGVGSGAVDGGKDPTLEGFGTGGDIDSLASSNNGAPNLGGGGGGGGGMNGGSGAGALPPEDGGGGPATGPYNTDVMGGLTGGGGGGGSYSGGGNGGGGESGSLFGSLAEKFNLKGFLPKADFKNRGLASGSGADGITGPNGPTLFEKIHSRYNKKQSELLP